MGTFFVTFLVVALAFLGLASGSSRPQADCRRLRWRRRFRLLLQGSLRKRKQRLKIENAAGQ